MKIFFMIILSMYFFGCATKANRPSTTTDENASKQVDQIMTEPSHVHVNSPVVIDYQTLQRTLGMDLAQSNLGYFEKVFNTCKVGSGYSETDDCKTRYLVAINFKLVCRDSEGTISTILTDDDLKAISGEKVSWALKNFNGSLVTDSEGQGQIIAAMPESARQQRLKLSVGSDFLFLKAGEVKRLIAPKNWCNH